MSEWWQKISSVSDYFDKIATVNHVFLFHLDFMRK